jgi:hypothetical protein
VVTWLVILSIYVFILTIVTTVVALRQNAMEADLIQLKIWKQQQERLQQVASMGHP